MEHNHAEGLANELARAMRPYCERIEIAGSIRRGKPEVKDIEIVATPAWYNQQDIDSLFGESKPVNRLYEWALTANTALGLQWIKPGVPGAEPWYVKPDGKYWRGLICDMKLDLFLATPQNWGIIFLIRTGSAEFSEAVVTHAKRIGKRCVNGGLQTSDGEPIPTPEEQTVFDVLNLAYVEPALRTGREALRGKR